jgi:hypothetical protein
LFVFILYAFFFIWFFVLIFTLIIYILFSISLQKIVSFTLLSLLLSLTKKVSSIRRMAERKNLYLTRLLPIPINFIGTRKISGYHFAFIFFTLFPVILFFSLHFFCPYFLIYISLFCSNCFFSFFLFFLHFTLNSRKPWWERVYINCCFRYQVWRFFSLCYSLNFFFFFPLCNAHC